MSDQVPAPQAQSRRAPRWLWVALTVSVAFNVLTLGLIGSAAWHMRQVAATSPYGLQARLTGFLATLPGERANAVKSAVQPAQSQIGRLRKDVWQARREAADIFAAEPFNKDRFLAIQGRALEAEQALRRQQAELVAGLAGVLTVEERQEFLKWRGPRGRKPGWQQDAGAGER